MDSVAAQIRRKYRVVAPELDERRRRQWAAAEAHALGHGGVKEWRPAGRELPL